MKKGIIAMLLVSFMSIAAINTTSAQDYRRTEQRTYHRDNGYVPQRTRTTTIIRKDRYHQPVDRYHRERTYYGYRRGYHRPYHRDYDRNRRGVEVKVRTHRTDYHRD